jgi:ankyrin repeat protein
MKWIFILPAVPVLCAALPLLISSPSGKTTPPVEPAGLSPLMNAATRDPGQLRALLLQNVDVHARTRMGNDALLMAARKAGNSTAVKLLLESGADPNTRNAFGATPLMCAVAAEDEESAGVLIAAGADVNAAPNPDLPGFLFGGGRTPLMWAAWRKNPSMIKILLKHGAMVNNFTGLGSALTQAAWASDAGIARQLLDAGADIHQRDLQWNFTALHWAAASEYASPDLVTLLLERGAEVDAEGGQPVDNFLGVPQTPLMLALQRGETPIVAALRKAGATLPEGFKTAYAGPTPVERGSSHAAVEAALAPLLHTAVESPKRFLAHASKQDCASCHQQHVPMLAFSAAESRGLLSDAKAAAPVQQQIEQFHTNDFVPEAVFYPEPAIEFGYALMNLHEQGKPRSTLTDGLVHHLLTIQARDGRWHYSMPRPPMQSSDVTATALAVRGLSLYSIPGREQEIDRAIVRGRSWLETCKAETNEEKAYWLLGLTWANASAAALRDAVASLLHDQRPDGGWGQLEHLPSDAYATGLSLYALMTSGAMPAGQDAVSRGTAFLKSTQAADGTWRVRRRAVPFQPPMQSEFPYDSWISSAGTSWAVLALTLAADKPDSAAKPLPGKSPPSPKAGRPTGTTAGHATSAGVDFEKDIAPVLERSCSGCHSGEKPRGNYAVTNREAFLTPGNRGDAILDFQFPEKSTLLRAVRGEIEDMEMPPVAKRAKFPELTEQELEKFDAWVVQGAPWPNTRRVANTLPHHSVTSETNNP